MHDFSEQLREYKYNPRYVMSDSYNTNLTVLNSFTKAVATELFNAEFPVYSITEGCKCLIEDISELEAHTGYFCTDKEFSNIIGAANGKDCLVGRIDLTVMGRRGEERRTLLYFDLTIFTRDIRKARDLAVPIEVQYFDSSSAIARNRQTRPKDYER